MNGTNCEQFSTRCEEHDCKTRVFAPSRLFWNKFELCSDTVHDERKMRFRLDFHDYLIVIRGESEENFDGNPFAWTLRSLSAPEWIIEALERLSSAFSFAHFFHEKKSIAERLNQWLHFNNNPILFSSPSILDCETNKISDLVCFASFGIYGSMQFSHFFSFPPAFRDVPFNFHCTSFSLFGQFSQQSVMPFLRYNAQLQSICFKVKEFPVLLIKNLWKQ